jgi:hypothetical protein
MLARPIHAENFTLLENLIKRFYSSQILAIWRKEKPPTRIKTMLAL